MQRTIRVFNELLHPLNLTASLDQEGILVVFSEGVYVPALVFLDTLDQPTREHIYSALSKL